MQCLHLGPFHQESQPLTAYSPADVNVRFPEGISACDMTAFGRLLPDEL